MSAEEQSVRIVTIKRPPPGFDAATQDNFHLGDIYEVSPNLGIFMTAAGWVRTETRKRKDDRRTEFHQSNIPIVQGDRRNPSDRRR